MPPGLWASHVAAAGKVAEVVHALHAYVENCWDKECTNAYYLNRALTLFQVAIDM